MFHAGDECFSVFCKKKNSIPVTFSKNISLRFIDIQFNSSFKLCMHYSCEAFGLLICGGRN